MHRFDAIVSTICYTLGTHLHRLHGGELYGPPYNDVTRFVLQQHQRMTDHLRFPLRCCTVAFDLTGILRRGRRFVGQGQETRIAEILSWKDSNLGACRDFVKFYESLVTLSLFARQPTLHQKLSPFHETERTLSDREQNE